jgi:hypothetical protein
MDPRTHLVAYLQGKYGLLLSPQQLFKEIPQFPVKQQSAKRQAGTFPITHKIVGEKSVYYSIYAVADFMLDDTPPQPKAPKAEVQKVQVKTRNRSDPNERFHDLTKILGGFVSNLEVQRDNIETLITIFKSKIEYREMQADLPTNGTKKKISAKDGGKV